MKKLIALMLCIVLAVSLLSACSDRSENKKTDETAATQAKIPTEPPTEFTVTPAGDADVQAFAEELPGKWISYNEKGIPYSYTFNKDGSLVFQKQGKDPADYSYTFEDGLLSVKNTKNTHTYQCSKDAVGMMTRLHNGEYQTYFAQIAEDIPGFGGCVYIVDGVMYMGDRCLCKEETVKKSDGDTIEGKWIGVVGDEVIFDPDGSYIYQKNASTYKGKYTVDFKKQSLVITIAGKSNDHDKTQWGLDGRVLHIGTQYYFRAAA